MYGACNTCLLCLNGQIFCTLVIQRKSDILFPDFNMYVWNIIHVGLKNIAMAIVMIVTKTLVVKMMTWTVVPAMKCGWEFLCGVERLHLTAYIYGIFIWATTVDLVQHPLFNSFRLSDTYMRQWIGSALVQIMACGLFGTKPLSKPMLDYCQLIT